MRDQDHAPAVGGVAHRVPDQPQQRIRLIEDIQRRVCSWGVIRPTSSHLQNSGGERLASLSLGDGGWIDSLVLGDLSDDGFIQVTEAQLLATSWPMDSAPAPLTCDTATAR